MPSLHPSGWSYQPVTLCQLMSSHCVQGLPTCLLFRDGSVIDRVDGFMPESTFGKRVRFYVSRLDTKFGRRWFQKLEVLLHARMDDFWCAWHKTPCSSRDIYRGWRQSFSPLERSSSSVIKKWSEHCLAPGVLVNYLDLNAVHDVTLLETALLILCNIAAFFNCLKCLFCLHCCLVWRLLRIVLPVYLFNCTNAIYRSMNTLQCKTQ